MCLVGMLTTGTAHSHHTSAAVFSTDDIEIEGFVTEFNFKNPHLNIILVVTDENGVETEWMATGPGPTPFRRWGWTPDTIQPGQYLRVFGRKSRDGGPDGTDGRARHPRRQNRRTRSCRWINRPNDLQYEHSLATVARGHNGDRNTHT